MSTSYGSLSTMPDRKVVQGTLELLILRTLLFAPCHGHGIAKHIQRISDDVLQVEHGSLYPALHRLEKSGCVASKWEQTDRGREMRMYRLTAKGRKQLTIEQSRWDELVRAMARVLRPS
jgi:PadR family transcriptional regulator, regulatory protein PadR